MTMLRFSRSLGLMGSQRALLSWVADITAHVDDHVPFDVNCWAATFGHPNGSVAWSAFVESEAAFASASAELLADEAYHHLVEAAQTLVRAPAEDRMQEIVRGEPGELPPLGAVANVTNAQAIVDRTMDAISFASEVAEHVEKVIDQQVAVLSDRYGPMGRMSWMTVAPDLATAEASAAKLRSDAGYIEMITGTAGLFIPGSGHVASFTRVG